MELLIKRSLKRCVYSSALSPFPESDLIISQTPRGNKRVILHPDDRPTDLAQGQGLQRSNYLLSRRRRNPPRTEPRSRVTKVRTVKS